MVELLLPADGELAAVRGLTDGLAGTSFEVAAVATMIPDMDVKPDMFVRVTTGGSVGRSVAPVGGVQVTDVHVLTLDAFALSEGDAVALAAYCSAILEAAGRAGELGGVTCNESSAGVPVNLPHPDVPTHYRYTVTGTARLRRMVG